MACEIIFFSCNLKYPCTSGSSNKELRISFNFFRGINVKSSYKEITYFIKLVWICFGLLVWIFFPNLMKFQHVQYFLWTFRKEINFKTYWKIYAMIILLKKYFSRKTTMFPLKTDFLLWAKIENQNISNRLIELNIF